MECKRVWSLCWKAVERPDTITQSLNKILNDKKNNFEIIMVFANFFITYNKM